VSERYRREIEDLLRNMDGRPLEEPMSGRLSRRTAGVRNAIRNGLRAFLRRPPVEQFMIASITLVLASLVLELVPPLAALQFWASILGLLFFVLAIGVSVARQRRPGSDPEPRWRGQPIEFRPRNRDLWSRLRQWLRGGR
jgi:hypothetical protein